MAVTWLLIIMAAAVFASMVLLAVVCVRCRNDGPLASIRQAPEEYPGFIVIHPAQPTIDRNSVHPSSNLLSPFSSSADPQRKRRSSIIETESNPSYENGVDGPDYINESDGESGYIVVLPEGEARPTDQSRPSTPSSDNHDYENTQNITTNEEAAPTNLSSVSPSPTRLSEDGDDDSQQYLNVEPLHFQNPSSDSDDDDDDDDDDDEGNYVNVTPSERPLPPGSSSIFDC